MKNLQETYEDKIGRVSINIENAIAGKLTDFKISYDVGEIGIDDSGAIKVLFRIVTDAGTPQFIDANADNYVEFESTNKDIDFTGISRSNCPAKLHTRPWCKGLQILLNGSHMSKDEKITIRFKNWKCQTIAEKWFEIKFLVDPFATDRFIEVPNNIGFKIIPDEPEKLVVLAQSSVKQNQDFKFLAKLEDRWGNVCTQISDERVNVSSGRCIKVDEPEIILKKGCAHSKVQLNSELGFIRATFNRMKAISNPIVQSSQPHFWADLHGQTEETVGQTSIEHYINFAQRCSLLDVLSHQGNDFQVTNDFWQKINNLSEEKTKSNEFVFFPGYEWSGNTSNGGDHNVIFRTTNQSISRSSHALIDDLSDINTDSPNIETLFSKLNEDDSLVIAHVGGRFASLDVENEKLRNLVEIHSVWGTFEWLLFEALEKGYNVGVVANSDGHHGRPGSSYPGLSKFNNFGGLTCILSEELDRNSIFEALKNRHCYATTGARIFIDSRFIIDDKKVHKGGDLCDMNSANKHKIQLKSHIVGTEHIDAVHIFNNNKKIKSVFPDKSDSQTAIKLLWSGSGVKGRKREINWCGTIRSEDGFELHERINFFNPGHTVKKSEKEIHFKGATTGGDQGIIFSCDDPTIKVLINKKMITINSDQLAQGSKEIFFPGLDASVKISEVIVDKCIKEVIVNECLSLCGERNAFFIKVEQRDGHCAWTSPLFVSKET